MVRRKAIRCAIYTRKSSEEGLEQDFNSLDAQREACEAYIKSQKQEGWTALPTFYDDGGLSGGGMKRPALERLLADIAAGLVDTVVVYKVDRLTRSLPDFAKIVEVFDRQQVAFVAVTQQFNTTTSLGRLTLNMLLSFAQFEREVTAARIRDKIVASKKKGMWMGGPSPLGYDIKDKKLVINQAEAKTVRHIYHRYVALGSVHDLCDELASDNILSKRRTDRYGRATGGKPLARGALYLMLHNRLYCGDITHKGNSYPRQHEAIIDEGLWKQVQTKLQTNRVGRRTGAKAKQPSLLAGLVYDDQGERLVPTHANKKGTRYRYYVSQPLIKPGAPNSKATDRRLPAGDLEALIEKRLTSFLANDAEVFDALGADINDLDHQKCFIDQAASLAEHWSSLDPSRKKAILQTFVHRIEVQREEVILQLRQGRLTEIIDPGWDPTAATAAGPHDEKILTLIMPAQLKRSGKERTLLIDGTGRRQPDHRLIHLLATAQRYHHMVMHSQGKSLCGPAPLWWRVDGLVSV